MSIAAAVTPLIEDVEVTDETITAYLVDGRVISVPLAWSWRLSEATPARRANWKLIGEGHGVHWLDVDEDISAEDMLHGVPAWRPSTAGPIKTTPANRKLQPTSRARRKAKSKSRSGASSRRRPSRHADDQAALRKERRFGPSCRIQVLKPRVYADASVLGGLRGR